MSVKVADVIVPEVFNPYMIQRTAELFAFYMGGIVSTGEDLNVLAQQGGKLINMPFWNDITGDDEVVDDNVPLTPGKIVAGQDVAALLTRARALGGNDLAGALAGSDPMLAIANMILDYKYRRLQAALIASLEGVFADNEANDGGDMVVDISIPDGNAADETNLIGPDSVVDATTGSMGDAWDKITGMALHSVVFGRLQKQNAIIYVDASGNPVAIPHGGGTSPATAQIGIPTYQGKRVIVDDGLPVEPGATSGFVYTSYFFGDGAIGYGEGNPKVPTEVDRDILAREEYLVHEWHVILHPRGVAFQSASVALQTPDNLELATEANWSRVYERKNVRLSALKTNG